MKKTFNHLLAALVLLHVSVPSWCYDGETFWVDGLRFMVTSENSKTCQLGDGATPAIQGYPTVVVIPSSVTHQDVTYIVTKIASAAFNSGRDITSITIPNSITYIYPRVFAGCI